MQHSDIEQEFDMYGEDVEYRPETPRMCVGSSFSNFCSLQRHLELQKELQRLRL